MFCVVLCNLFLCSKAQEVGKSQTILLLMKATIFYQRRDEFKREIDAMLWNAERSRLISCHLTCYKVSMKRSFCSRDRHEL